MAIYVVGHDYLLKVFRNCRNTIFIFLPVAETGSQSNNPV